MSAYTAYPWRTLHLPTGAGAAAIQLWCAALELELPSPGCSPRLVPALHCQPLVTALVPALLCHSQHAALAHHSPLQEKTLHSGHAQDCCGCRPSQCHSTLGTRTPHTHYCGHPGTAGPWTRAANDPSVSQSRSSYLGLFLLESAYKCLNI